MARNQSKTAMVTGSGSGIGKAVSQRLAQEGYTVFGGVINKQEAESARVSIKGDYHPILIDVRNEASVETAYQQVEKMLGGRSLDLLFNAAGIITNGPLIDLDEDTFANILAVNVIGTHSVSRAFLPALKRASRSTIINMSSASGTRTLPFTGAYSASKFGVEALTTAMRLEFSPYGVAVTAIAPGLINTPMASKIQSDLKKRPSDSIYDVPLKRFLEGTERSSQRGIPMERVVSTILAAAIARKPKPRYEIHNNYFRDVVLMRILPHSLREAAIRKTLSIG